MKRMSILAAALALGLSAPVAQAQRLTDQERRELETRLEQLRQELREIERRLGRTRALAYSFGGDAGPMVFGGRLDRPRLGVVIATGRRPETDSIGAALQAVTPDGPAHEAGLRAGDIVTRFRGEVLANARPYPGDRLIEMAREMNAGDSIAVTYRRHRDTRTATIVPEVLDDFAYATVMPRIAEGVRMFGDSMRTLFDTARTNWRVITPDQSLHLMPGAYGFSIGLGTRWSDLELVELNPQLGDYFGTTEGLLVVKPPRDSLLQLRSGDVILRIGGRVPSSPSHAVRIFRSYEPGDEIRLEVMRQKRRQELRAVVPEPERGSAR
jgi:S1-C subfamily serine protease